MRYLLSIILFVLIGCAGGRAITDEQVNKEDVQIFRDEIDRLEDWNSDRRDSWP